MTTTVRGQEVTLPVAGLPVRLRRGGVGPPVIVLPDDVGCPGWLPFHAALAAHHEVMAVTLPGYDGSEQPAWMRSVRDMAVLLHLLLDDLGLDRVRAVGVGLGGWIAAEMATMQQRRFAALGLVGAVGIQPDTGEIRDQFLEAHEPFVRDQCHDPAVFHALYGDEPTVQQLVLWDQNREMTARIAWKPYLFSQTLPMLLRGVRTPALVLWGDDDRVVPAGCGRQYAAALPQARFEVVPHAGHAAHLDQPAELAARLIAFFASV